MSTKKLLNQREGLKGGIERLLSQVEAYANAGQHLMARRCMELLDTYMVKCREVQYDLQGNLQQDELENESTSWMDFELTVVEAKARIDSCLQLEPEGTPSFKAEPQQHSEALPGPQLPRWDLPAFNGNVLEFVAFWDQFEASVHNRQELSDATKFVYLKSALKGIALEAVAGLSLIAANYAIAVDMLKNRFGRPSVIIQNHSVAVRNTAVQPRKR
uniref:HAT C-terminal dimerisation domain-containing protein n=1 Tax=Trichuris muris TaxID=70415 RepID=A0A5S6QMV0_TRIMR